MASEESNLGLGLAARGQWWSTALVMAVRTVSRIWLSLVRGMTVRLPAVVLPPSSVHDLLVQTGRFAVHRWLGWYRSLGLDGLADGSHRPHAHPAQTSPEVEAAICELRRQHPRWGQRRIEFELGRKGCPGPIPSLSTIYFSGPSTCANGLDRCSALRL
jgi:hypothetical protein